MPSKLIAASLAVLVGLMFVPQVSAEEQWSYHRTIQASGTASGNLCFQLPVTELELCQGTSVTWEYSYFAEIPCGGNLVWSDNLEVQGLVHGEGVKGIGTWYVGPVTYVGGYGVDLPFVYTGSAIGDSSVDVWGSTPLSGGMSFSGTGFSIVTAETVQERCPDASPPNLPPVVDCLLAELQYRCLFE